MEKLWPLDLWKGSRLHLFNAIRSLLATITDDNLKKKNSTSNEI